MQSRRLLTALCSALLVASLAGAPWLAARVAGCSMCGATCCCSKDSGDGCSVRRAGCGGDAQTTVGPIGSERAVLVAGVDAAPRVEAAPFVPSSVKVPRQRPRAPLDHPPPASC
ncbi:MAG TPA: hypothetical protein VFB67_06730 [Candidatus Polarisedimenticolaceae bacterium]|nr:hypothetical protein [Candidatus Polarisedimenticolaceae bacterium]